VSQLRSWPARAGAKRICRKIDDKRSRGSEFIVAYGMFYENLASNSRESYAAS